MADLKSIEADLGIAEDSLLFAQRKHKEDEKNAKAAARAAKQDEKERKARHLKQDRVIQSGKNAGFIELNSILDRMIVARLRSDTGFLPKISVVSMSLDGSANYDPGFDSFGAQINDDNDGFGGIGLGVVDQRLAVHRRAPSHAGDEGDVRVITAWSHKVASNMGALVRVVLRDSHTPPAIATDPYAPMDTRFRSTAANILAPGIMGQMSWVISQIKLNGSPRARSLTTKQLMSMDITSDIFASFVAVRSIWVGTLSGKTWPRKEVAKYANDTAEFLLEYFMTLT